MKKVRKEKKTYFSFYALFYRSNIHFIFSPQPLRSFDCAGKDEEKGKDNGNQFHTHANRAHRGSAGDFKHPSAPGRGNHTGKAAVGNINHTVGGIAQSGRNKPFRHFTHGWKQQAEADVIHHCSGDNDAGTLGGQHKKRIEHCGERPC